MPHDVAGRYGREGAVFLIEIRLKEARQLFHSLDPAPFREKDLDADAEAYIVESVRDLPPSAAIKLVIYLPAPSEDHRSGIPEAVRNYFSYRSASLARHLRDTLSRGRASLLIGTAFLGACLALRGAAPSEVLREGLLIIGWVAMWRPLQIFLYDWWPIRSDLEVHRRIAAMSVEVRPERA